MKKEKKQEEVKQYELGLKEPFTNRFWKLRNSINERFLRFEKFRFLRNTPFWMLLSLIILLNVLVIDYFIELTRVAPDMVPLLNNFIRLEPRLVEREMLYFLPLFLGSFSIYLLITAIYIFNRKPYFSMLVLITSFLTLLTALINIVSLTNQYL